MATTTKKPASTEKEIKIVKKDNSFQMFADGTSRLTRKDLPSIIDKTENLIAWLIKNNFKAADIDIIGNKPESWDTTFGITPPA